MKTLLEISFGVVLAVLTVAVLLPVVIEALTPLKAILDALR